jgi:hypothetical protein
MTWLSDTKRTKRDASTSLPMRGFLYGGYLLCMIVSFINLVLSIYLIGISMLIMFVWTFTKAENT